jgi:hypothetical protein
MLLDVVQLRKETKMTRLLWDRRFENSSNNFDLLVRNPDEVEPERLSQLLTLIMEERHRQLTLSRRASVELQRWFSQPATPLKSAAYVLLSNWFLTDGGDRNSLVAGRCEALWDALFLCRPLRRLSPSKAGTNHVMLIAEFDSFWARMLDAQGERTREPQTRERILDAQSGKPFYSDGIVPESIRAMTPKKEISGESLHSNGVASENIRAVLTNKGIRCELEASPRGLAELLRTLPGWEPE